MIAAVTSWSSPEGAVGDSVSGLTPSQTETGLDPLIHNQITGSQRALDVRTE